MWNEFMDLYALCGVAWFLRGLVLGVWRLTLSTSEKSKQLRRDLAAKTTAARRQTTSGGAFQVVVTLIWFAAICFLALKCVFWPIDVAMHIKKASS